MAKVLSIDAQGNTVEIQGNSTSAGAADASKLVQLDSTGKLDISLLPNGIGADANAFTASEALAAGDFVNIYDNGGTPNIRKADATAVGKQAHGYVLAAVTQGAQGTVYFDDTNNQVTGLANGATLFLSPTTPGKTTVTPPSTTGQILQKLGVATSATSIHVAIEKPIVRA